MPSRLRRKAPLYIILFTLIPLACNCRTVTLPFTTPADIPTSSQPSAIPPAETPVGPPSISKDEAPFNIPWDDRSLFTQRLTSSYKSILTSLPGASIYHLAFSLSDPPVSINGLEEVRYTNQENVSLTEVDFALYPEILGGTINVGNVLLDGELITPIFSTGLMRLPLVTPLPPGQSVIIHMGFSITVPNQGGDFYYGIYGFNDGILSLAQAYPTILVYNESGWNNQTPDLIGDPLFSDISLYLVSIDAPADLALVASGVEVDQKESALRQHVLYADGPARDFYLAASKDFVQRSETVNGITFNSFAPASLDLYTHSALKAAEAAVDDFNYRYASYPYTEFNIVTITTSAGGVEFPGMTALSERIYSQSDYLESVVVHEVGHQWFYNLVGNQTQQQPWLDESLAQFVTWQYFFDTYGNQAAESFLSAIQGRWDKLDDEKIPIGKSVSAYTPDEYGAIVYGRGMFFFLALRQQIGQANFDSLMHDYATSFSWDIATTDKFKRLAEQHCSCDLSPLFQEWVYP
jgi:hypothetical protein